MLKNQLRPAIGVTLVLMLITGLIYPGLVTAVAQLLFPRQANGLLITRNGQVTGSELIGQSFARADYFHPRPSAAGNGYDDTLSTGTNKGPTDRKLDSAVRGQVPADLVTSSGSGLDPHISPASALLQVNRVARARGVGPARVRALVLQHTADRQFGFFGERRVNVLLLNLALDSVFARKP
jgi:potassium-transporting ATPase KdpC subunit